MFVPYAALIEHDSRGATRVPEIRKLSDVLAEELISKNSRDNKTAIELFLAELGVWEAGLRRQFDEGKHNP